MSNGNSVFHDIIYNHKSLLFSKDEKLKNLAEKCGTENWSTVAGFFPDRNEAQCSHRWQKVVNPELVKGPWTKEVCVLQLLKLVY